MLFLKPDVKEKKLFFSPFVLFDLLLTASNLLFDLAKRLDPSQI